MTPKLVDKNIILASITSAIDKDAFCRVSTDLSYRNTSVRPCANISADWDNHCRLDIASSLSHEFRISLAVECTHQLLEDFAALVGIERIPPRLR